MPDNPLDTTGRTVIVTGATMGLGRVIATRFLEHGADVIVCARREPDEPVAAGGRQAVFVAADVRDPEQVAAVVEHAVDRTGRIDVLVNNAGLNGPMLHFFEGDEAWWRRIVDVNLTGHFLVAHPVARIMARQGGGCIINMSSGGATQAHRCFTAYDAAKGGVEGLTRAMALDLAPYNIRVNALVPGTVDTVGMSSEARALRGDNLPLGRMAEPYDMTGAALFLASDDAAYITGDVLRVDGGMLAQQRSATVDIMPPENFPPLEEI